MFNLTNIAYGFVSAVMVFLLGIILWLGLSNAHIKSKLARAESDRAALRLANDNFARAVIKQNSAIEAIQNAQKIRNQQMMRAIAIADKDNKNYAIEAQNILAEKKSDRDCADAKIILGKFMGGRKMGAE